jgi:hypothetical protein
VSVTQLQGGTVWAGVGWLSSLFMLYAPLRLFGLLTGDAQMNDYAISILSCESALLFPR